MDGTGPEHNIKSAAFRLPGDEDRTAVIGQTGSGKTWFGVWLLSHASINRRPWIVVDYKRAKIFRQLGRHAFRSMLTPRSSPPRKPGLHLIQPLESDDDAMDDFFWRCWGTGGGIGFYLDEAMMVPAGRGSGMRAILTQGREMQMPIIACSQRPVEIDRYFFSESQFFAVFFLMDRDDRVTVRRYTPVSPDMVPDPHHCFWYDSGKRRLIELTPVPDANQFLGAIRSRTPRRLWFDL